MVDRRSRQSKPTLGDSIAAAEAAREQQSFIKMPVQVPAALLTTGVSPPISIFLNPRT